MFDGFEFLEERKKTYCGLSGIFLRLTGHSEPLSDNRISRWCMGEWCGWRDRKRIPNGMEVILACQPDCSLASFGVVTPVYLHLCIHGVINNKERHRALLIFSLHSPLPSFFFLSPWSFGDYRLFSMLASFPQWSTMAEAPPLAALHIPHSELTDVLSCLSRSGEAFMNNKESASRENYLYHSSRKLCLC